MSQSCHSSRWLCRRRLGEGAQHFVVADELRQWLGKVHGDRRPAIMHACVGDRDADVHRLDWAEGARAGPILQQLERRGRARDREIERRVREAMALATDKHARRKNAQKR